MCCTLVAGLCRRSSNNSPSSSTTALEFCICSFAAVFSRQPPSSCHCSSATNRHRRPLTCLHRSVLPPLVSHRCPLPHPTLFACLPPWIVAPLSPCPTTLFHCHTVVFTPPLSSLDSHRHPLHCCVVLAHHPPLDRCLLIVVSLL